MYVCNGWHLWVRIHKRVCESFLRVIRGLKGVKKRERERERERERSLLMSWVVLRSVSLTPMVPGWTPRSQAASWVVLRSVSSSFGCQNRFENRFKTGTQKVRTSHAELLFLGTFLSMGTGSALSDDKIDQALARGQTGASIGNHGASGRGRVR